MENQFLWENFVRVGEKDFLRTFKKYKFYEKILLILE
jgi:hypothetical protein